MLGSLFVTGMFCAPVSKPVALSDKAQKLLPASRLIAFIDRAPYHVQADPFDVLLLAIAIASSRSKTTRGRNLRLRCQPIAEMDHSEASSRQSLEAHCSLH